ncbi:uncharacterized protein LOC130967216 [Arachis stenosperma]|uniref:uncharacterized protein LOC130967216 n=1 Tax=Arachis stenosperma TaxID=217475 RepID=UPI0025ACB176|nr:uncharacterized protein LOC130967216 [Arachis stenosperma]
MRSEIKFTNKDLLSVFMKPSTSFTEFQDIIIRKLGLQGMKRVEKLLYRIPIFLLLDNVKYDSFVIGSDEYLEVLFHSTAACSSSRPVGVSSSLPVIEPEAVLVTSPSFAGDLNRTRDRERVDTGSVVDVAIAMADIDDVVPEFRQGGAPDGVEDDKEEVVLSVKTYSIRCGIEYKVLESDYCKYHGKCKYFGNGCTWMIRISLRQRRGIWEIKRYNRSHTCLATSISSDHMRLDYHVISAFILSMIRSDAVVSIKVFQNATKAHFGFRPNYMKVWMAKQKVVAQIYGD